MKKTALAIMALAVLLFLPTKAFALAGEDDDPPAAEGEEGSGDEAFLEGKEKPDIPPPAADKSASLEEDPKKWYFGIGGRIRMHIVPASFYRFKVVGAYDEVGYGVGIDGTFRLKGLDIVPSVWFHDVSHKNAKMKEHGDPEWEKELVINDMRLIMITCDFLQSVRILSWLQFFYGAGVGLGIPVTRIKRWELESDGSKCSGPRPGDNWCDEGGSYGEKDPWPVYPYLNILVGLRFKPIPNFVADFDFGIGTGIIIGARASYIF